MITRVYRNGATSRKQHKIRRSYIRELAILSSLACLLNHPNPPVSPQYFPVTYFISHSILGADLISSIRDPPISSSLLSSTQHFCWKTKV
jgi:hypothetical protein